MCAMPYREAAQRLPEQGQRRQGGAEVAQQAREHTAYGRDAEQRADLATTCTATNMLQGLGTLHTLRTSGASAQLP